MPSSRSLKEQITALSSDEALAILAGLDPVKFAYKSDGEQGLQVGFIAEEVPDLIATHDRRGIKPIDIVAVLAKVVKDQQKAIASLARQVATAERER